MKYLIKYQCGHEGYVSLFGPGSQRERKISWLENNCICPECQKKENQTESENAAQFAKENEWAELIGSEKQIKWAETIRKNMYDKAMKAVEGFVAQEMPEESIDQYVEIVETAMTMLNRASEWIDHRDDRDIRRIIRLHEQDIQDEIARRNTEASLTEEEKEIIKEAEAELTVRQEERYDGIVKITVGNDNDINLEYVKSEDFITLVKREYHYRWNGETWAKKVYWYNGSINDRIAEIGSVLLQEGYTVKFPTVATKEAAVNGTYEPEQKRWIYISNGKFALMYEPNDTLYRELKRTNGSKYDTEIKKMTFPLDCWKTILDVAELHNFRIRDDAQQEIDRQRQADESISIVQVIDKIASTEEDKERLQTIINKDIDVLEELRDED